MTDYVRSFYDIVKRTDFESGMSNGADLALEMYIEHNGVPLWIEDFVKEYSESDSRSVAFMLNTYARTLRHQNDGRLEHLIKCFKMFMSSHKPNMHFETIEIAMTALEHVDMQLDYVDASEDRPNMEHDVHDLINSLYETTHNHELLAKSFRLIFHDVDE
jgi:hypothetical protein